MDDTAPVNEHCGCCSGVGGACMVEQVKVGVLECCWVRIPAVADEQRDFERRRRWFEGKF